MRITAKISATAAALLLTTGCAGFPVAGVAPDSPPAASGVTGTRAEADLYLELVEGLIRQKRHRAALAFLDQYAASGAPATPRFLLLRGEALLGSGKEDNARAVFARLAETSYAGEALDGEGRAEAALGHWASAEQYLGGAVKVLPSRADFLNNLAFVKLQAGQRRAPDAVADLRAARELNPQSDVIRDNLILALTLADEPAEATRVLATIADAREREAVTAFAARWVQDQAAATSGPRIQRQAGNETGRMP